MKTEEILKVLNTLRNNWKPDTPLQYLIDRYTELHNQQPEVIACQGEGESAGEKFSGYSESGKSEEYPSADINNIINKERKIWQQANPEARTLLKKFANKIKLEIDLGGHKK